jgi:hypothetical protein
MKAKHKQLILTIIKKLSTREVIGNMIHIFLVIITYQDISENSKIPNSAIDRTI